MKLTNYAIVVCVAALLGLTGGTVRAGATFTTNVAEGDFTWAGSMNYSWASTGSAYCSIGRGDTSGNPGAGMVANITASGTDMAAAYIFKQNAQWWSHGYLSVQAMDFRVDTREYNADGLLADVGMMLLQNNVFYTSTPVTRCASVDWTTQHINGLTAADFAAADGSHPDFSTAGGAMKFGFYARATGITTQYTNFDNLYVTVTSASSHASMIYSNYGAESNHYGVLQTDSGAGTYRKIAQAFTTPSDGTYQLTWVSPDLGPDNGNSGYVDMQIWSEVGGLPGEMINDLGSQLIDYKGGHSYHPTAPVYLEPGKTYFIVGSAPDGSTVDWMEDDGVNELTAWNSQKTGYWTNGVSFGRVMNVGATLVPEPGCLGLLGLGTLSLLARRRR